MKAQRQLFTLLVAVTMVAPAAAATWYGFGTYEPDTDFDARAGYMWPDADQTPGGKQIYFNAYPTEFPTGFNPNVGELGSRVLVPGARYFVAMFGVWKDCNGDDHVGMAESAVVVYRATLLTQPALCPPGSLHNDGTWVWEYVAIGNQTGETTPNAHSKQILDPDAKVWGDFGLPSAPPAATCPIIPLPHGTTAGTGWMIRYADCFAGKRIVRTANEIDSDGSLGLRFEDENRPQGSSSHLNQHLPESLFGNPETCETGTLQLDSHEDVNCREEPATAYDTWDCDGDRTYVRDPTPGGMLPKKLEVADPTGGLIWGGYGKFDENLTDESGAYAWFAEPAPNLNDPRDSWADGFNQTFRGFHTGGNEDYDWSAWGGTCKTTGNDNDGDNTYAGVHQTAFFYPDGPHEGGTQVKGKKASDMVFQYFNGAKVEGADALLLGENRPNGAGVARNGGLLWNPGWYSNTVWTTAPQSVDRNSGDFQGGLYSSFYATAGNDTRRDFSARVTEPGVYGSDACGLNKSGVHKEWQCDEKLWYTDSTGNPAPASPWNVRVHAKYYFLDVDCTDGTLVRNVGVYASLAAFSPHPPCKDAPGRGPLDS